MANITCVLLICALPITPQDVCSQDIWMIEHNLVLDRYTGRVSFSQWIYWTEHDTVICWLGSKSVTEPVRQRDGTYRQFVRHEPFATVRAQHFIRTKTWYDREVENRAKMPMAARLGFKKYPLPRGLSDGRHSDKAQEPARGDSKRDYSVDFAGRAEDRTGQDGLGGEGKAPD